MSLNPFTLISLLLFIPINLTILGLGIGEIREANKEMESDQLKFGNLVLIWSVLNAVILIFIAITISLSVYILDQSILFLIFNLQVIVISSIIISTAILLLVYGIIKRKNY